MYILNQLNQLLQLNKNSGKSARNVGHSLIVVTIVLVSIIIPFLFLDYEVLFYYHTVVFIPIFIVIILILAGFGIFRMVSEYKLSKSLTI